MSEKISYYDQLRHPNWQKKRLTIMQMAGFECEDCGTKDKTLNVHHSYYEKDLAPWEYPDQSLHCLCEDCHKKAQDIDLMLKRQLGKVELSNMAQLLGYAMALESLTYPMVVLDVFSYEVALGVGDAWGLNPEEVIDALQDKTIDGWKLEQMRRVKSGKSKDAG